ncbi:MAG: glycosyltransferase family 4 protein [Pseudomonadota bacterium]
MHLAFYAPLKPVNHPKPSGERTFARALLDTLRSIEDVAEVSVASDLRSRDGAGEKAVQQSIYDASEKELNRLESYNFDAWITYHNYYKAPDLIGPVYSKRKGIPYLLIEATRAQKRLTGAWADFAASAEAASDAADTVFYLTDHDFEALSQYRPPHQKLVHLRPFLNQDTLPAGKTPAASLELLAVAMLRFGDKLESFTALAEALRLVSRTDWTLRIIGDGPARAQVETLFAEFGQKVQFLGQASPTEVSKAMARASCLVWPGVNEAFGMVYLEAQALGLRVIAEDRPGVRDVVGPTGQMAPQSDPASFAALIDALPPETPDSIAICRQFMVNRLRPNARNTIADTLRHLV